MKQGGELVDKFRICVCFDGDKLWWEAALSDKEWFCIGSTAQQAICRCVVASVFGDEVEL